MQLKRSLIELPPQVHGGIHYSDSFQSREDADAILDFSVNCNPYGPPPGTKKIVANVLFSCYPDSNATELRQALAKKHRIHANNIFIGSGSTEIIRLIPAAFLYPGDQAIIPSPTYSEYELSCRIMGLKILPVHAAEKNNYYWDINHLIQRIKTNSPAAIFLCNPNNPTGQYLTESEVTGILNASSRTLVILDEAYISFTEEVWSSLELLNNENLVIIRSMTKDYSLAGLRLGYAIANPKVIISLCKVKAPWNVSTVAQAAALYVIQHDAYLQQCKVRIKQARDILADSLIAIGFKVIPSQSNFFLIRVGNAKKFKTALLTKKILVRDCTSFGLPSYIRISPRSISECKKLINAVKEIGIS